MLSVLNRSLRSSAISLGLCQQWQSEWQSDKTPDELIRMFRRGQDFCIAHDFPTLETIRACFSPSDLERNGIYLDADLDTDTDSQSSDPENPHATTLQNGTYIFLGTCRGTVRFPRWSAAILYVRHDSHLHIEAGDFSRIQIHLYDTATALPASVSPTARLTIFPH